MEDTRDALRRQQLPIGTVCIFLDIDGVLNSAEMLQRIPGCFDRRDRAHMLDIPACNRLERVLTATGAKIVLSSSWRVMQTAATMETMLRRRGVKSAEVIDVTPGPGLSVNDCKRRSNLCTFDNQLEYGERGHEIAKWLFLHPEVTTFAIVDDNSDMAHLHHRFVQTTWANGMLDEHADRLIEMLCPRDLERLTVPQIATR